MFSQDPGALDLAEAQAMWSLLSSRGLDLADKHLGVPTHFVKQTQPFDTPELSLTSNGAHQASVSILRVTAP